MARCRTVCRCSRVRPGHGAARKRLSAGARARGGGGMRATCGRARRGAAGRQTAAAMHHAAAQRHSAAHWVAGFIRAGFTSNVISRPPLRTFTHLHTPSRTLAPPSRGLRAPWRRTGSPWLQIKFFIMRDMHRDFNTLHTHLCPPVARQRRGLVYGIQCSAVYAVHGPCTRVLGSGVPREDSASLHCSGRSHAATTTTTGFSPGSPWW